MWAHIAKAADAKLNNGSGSTADFFKAKLVTGRFFVERVMPETGAHLARIRAGAGSIMELPAEAF
jgi:acyl-CoA dehydrogenase